jgi:biotin synthase
MNNFITKVATNILEGRDITFKEAVKIISIKDSDTELLDTLFNGANKIREKYMGDVADLCTIMNVKSGNCSEDCTYCSQSAHYNTLINQYDTLDYKDILKRALEVKKSGAHRFSLVTSGRGIENDKDLDILLNIYKNLKKDTGLKLCASHGIINYKQALKLKEAGVSMYHHNIETCRTNYSNICTTHTYNDRISTIKNVLSANIEVCCGGILGLGETDIDRVKMFFEIKELNIRSIPLNILMPVKGTPLESKKILSPNNILKSLAVCRYINPNAFIRYAGGRMALKNKQNAGFKAGINGALVGNYLTTIGSNIEEDKKMILSMGFKL